MPIISSSSFFFFSLFFFSYNSNKKKKLKYFHDKHIMNVLYMIETIYIYNDKHKNKINILIGTFFEQTRKIICFFAIDSWNDDARIAIKKQEKWQFDGNV